MDSDEERDSAVIASVQRYMADMAIPPFFIMEMASMGKMFPRAIGNHDQRLCARTPPPHRKFPVPDRKNTHKKGRYR